MQSILTGSITSFYASGGDGYSGMSGTGKYLVGRRNAGQSNGQVAISSDYGASSTIPSQAFPYSSAMQISVTGQYILFSINGYGQYAVYLSSDFGSTWTNHGLACYWTPAPNLAISSTGQYMAAGSNNYAGSTCGASGYFSVSSNYGVTWTRRTATLCWQRIVFVSVSTSAATSGVMIVAIGNAFTSGTTSCSSTMNVMSSLDLGVTWTVLSSTTLTPSLPAVPGGAVGSITVFYKAISSDVYYTFATITASTTTLQGTYGCPYIPTSASSNGKVYVAIDSAGNVRISNLKLSTSLTSWSPAVSPVSLTACTNALLTGDGMSVTSFCGTNVYRTTIIDHSPTMQPSGQPSIQPSRQPSQQPSVQPSAQPSRHVVNMITTYAGSGTQGNSGDGGAATNAQLYAPQGLFVDASGIVYIADSNNNAVKKVDANGIISTLSFGGLDLGYPRDVIVDVSGNIYVSSWVGSYVVMKSSTTSAIYACSVNYGYSGDGGPATSAQCRRPLGMAVASNGDLYFADFNNDRVRMVKRASGIITTVAGTGVGNGASEGEPQAYGPDNTIATSVGIWPVSVVLNEAAGLLYVMGYGSTSLGYHLSALNLATGILKYVAGTGVYGHSGDGGSMSSARLGETNKIAIDQLGNVYIGEVTPTIYVRYLNFATGIISTIVGTGQPGYSGDGGPASLATINGGNFLFVDNVGKFLYLGDRGNNVVRRVDISHLIPDPIPSGQPSRQPSQQPTSRPSIQLYETFAECTTGSKISGVRFCNGWSSYGDLNLIKAGTTVVYGIQIVPSSYWVWIPQSYPAGLQNAIFFQQEGPNQQYANWDVSMNKTYSGVTPFTLYSLQFWLTSQTNNVPTTFTVKSGGSVVYSTLPLLYQWTQATTASICAPSSSLVVQFRATANGVQSAMAVAGVNLVAGASCVIQPSSQPSGT